ncbi:MAG: DUF484 family protein [Steroidobacteraceae bacterium]
MSTNTARGLATEAGDEKNIAGYLDTHPDFFERHPNTLMRMSLAHQRGTATVSLIERQVDVLRNRNGALEKRIGEFVSVARANEQLTDKIHNFTLRLLRADGFAPTVAVIEASLREDFGAFHAALVLPEGIAPLVPGDHGRFVQLVPPEDRDWQSFANLLETGKPRCGQARDSQRRFLFGPEAEDIASMALVPIILPQGRALLALGSPDPARFNPGMSTEFLARIAALTGAALSRR